MKITTKGNQISVDHELTVQILCGECGENITGDVESDKDSITVSPDICEGCRKKAIDEAVSKAEAEIQAECDAALNTHVTEHSEAVMNDRQALLDQITALENELKRYKDSDENGRESEIPPKPVCPVDNSDSPAQS